MTQLSALGAAIAAPVLLGGCDWEVPTAIAVGFALMIVFVRYVAGVERRYQAHRTWLLTRGVRTRARLDDLTVRSSSPHGRVATSVIGVTLTFTHQGNPTTQVHKQSVPTSRIERMKVGEEIPIGVNPDKPSDLTIDHERL